MVDWKKEISFGGGKKQSSEDEQAAPAPAEATEQTSIWKKELSLGGGKKKQPKEPKQPKAAKVETQSAGDDVPFWKKEISFGGGKPKAPKQPKQAKAPKPKPEGDAVPFWKKELSFGGGKKKKESDAPDVAPVEETSILDADEPAAVELLNAYVPEVSNEQFLVALEDAHEVAPAEPVVEIVPEPAAAVVPEQPVVELVPDPVLEQPTIQFPVAVPDLEPEPEQPVAEVVDFLTASLPAAPEATQIDLSFASTPAPEPVVELPEPVVEPEPELPPAASAAPPPVAAAPDPVVVHPPVPSAALPPLDDEQPKQRKKKEKAPKADGERVPFYKRELSFGRKKTDEPAEPRPQKEEKEKKAKVEKPKRERRSLSFSLPKPQPRARGGGRGKAPKKIVGLKIGASQLAAASVENNGHAEVVQVARRELDPGIVSNGELREPDLLADALKEFFSKNKLPKRGVRLGIATNRIGVRTLEIAGIEDPKQLANAIRFRAQEALPIPIDEAMLDYQILDESKNDEGETVRKILLVLAYRDLIDRYVGACRKAGIQLVGIDLEAFALLRALAAPREQNVEAQAALVAVTVGHDRTTFAVSDGRVCEFTRVLDWGGHSLNVGIARALDMAPSEVDGYKRGLSLDGNEVPEGLTDDQAREAREALRRQVQSFARELVSSLQFYQNQPGSLGIGEIVLTGGTAHLGGLADELQRLIGVRVRVGDPLVRVKVGKKMREPEQLGSFAVAIGLGIED